MKSIFAYNDYRQFLQDFFQERKNLDKGFSWRKFSASAGYNSPVFLKLVIENKTNLSEAGTERVADAVWLSGREKKYFRLLVRFNQAKNDALKHSLYKELRNFVSPQDVHVLEQNQYDYYKEWYHAAIRERLTQVDDQSDYQDIGRSLFPQISAAKVQKSIELLKKLGLIEEKDGRLVQSDSKISTGPEVLSMAVRNMHRQMAVLAAEAVQEIPREERDISGLTLGVSWDGFEKLSRELALFRERVTQIVEEDKASDMVYRLNLQLFPLSRSELAKSGGENA